MRTVRRTYNKNTNYPTLQSASLRVSTSTRIDQNPKNNQPSLPNSKVWSFVAEKVKSDLKFALVPSR